MSERRPSNAPPRMSERRPSNAPNRASERRPSHAAEGRMSERRMSRASRNASEVATGGTSPEASFTSKPALRGPGGRAPRRTSAASNAVDIVVRRLDELEGALVRAASDAAAAARRRSSTASRRRSSTMSFKGWGRRSIEVAAPPAKPRPKVTLMDRLRRRSSSEITCLPAPAATPRAAAPTAAAPAAAVGILKKGKDSKDGKPAAWGSRFAKLQPKDGGAAPPASASASVAGSPAAPALADAQPKSPRSPPPTSPKKTGLGPAWPWAKLKRGAGDRVAPASTRRVEPEPPPAAPATPWPR